VRQLITITGILDLTHMLAKMDMLHSFREKMKRVREVYRTGCPGTPWTAAMFCCCPPWGGVASNLGMYVRGTLWSNDAELNKDGTMRHREILRDLMYLEHWSIPQNIKNIKTYDI
jgi:hypothetical protein